MKRKKESLGKDHEEQKTAYCWVDGSCPKNPGACSVGVYILDYKGQGLYEGGGYIGNGSNNWAEYGAVLSGLLIAEWLGYRFVKVHSDSQVVVKQLSGEYGIKSPTLQEISDVVKAQKQRFLNCEIVDIPRERNKVADSIAQGLSKRGNERDVKFYRWFWSNVNRLKG